MAKIGSSQDLRCVSLNDPKYQILVRQEIDAGLEDLRDGRTHDPAAIRREFGLP